MKKSLLLSVVSISVFILSVIVVVPVFVSAEIASPTTQSKPAEPTELSTFVVTYPKGGENMVKGDPMLIKWTPKLPVSTVEIVSADGSYSFGIYGSKYGNTNPIQTGEYTYNVTGTIPADTYYVRVTTRNGMQAASNKFTINTINQPGVWCYNWDSNLMYGSSASVQSETDVSYLQMALMKEGFEISTSEQKGGSVFGETTKAAVAKFQQKYGIPGTGFVGPLTRAKLHSLYGCVQIATLSPITVLSPNGGEEIAKNESLGIFWNSTSPLQPVDVWLVNQLGRVLPEPALGNVRPTDSNSQSLGVATYNLETGQYKARVCVAGTNNCDDSDRFFRIIPAVTGVRPVISLTRPPSVSVGSVLTVNATGAGRMGNIILTTADGSKMWSTGYATDVSRLPGFSRYDGSTLSFTIPSTIGRGVHPDGWWNEPTVPVTDGDYKLYLTSLDANNNFIKSNVVTVKVGKGDSDVAQDVKVEAKLMNRFTDRAGTWGQFSPGIGAQFTDKADWNWDLILKLDSSKTIKSIGVYHKGPGAPEYTEAWSSESPDYYGRNSFPLVVVKNGRQLNTDYNQSLGTYRKGSHKFILYGQVESTRFYGGLVVVKFADGTSFNAEIPDSSFVPPQSIITPPTVEPLIKVINPRGGEVFRLGDQMNMSWNTGAGSGTEYVSLILRKTDTPDNFPANSGSQAGMVVNNGNYSWKIQNIETGEYILRITCEPVSGCPMANSRPFTITSSAVVTPANRPPVISSVTSLTNLKVNEIGTWVVRASDPENVPLAYSVNWGDVAQNDQFVRSSTFQHSYSQAGRYTIVFTVKDDAGNVVDTRTTVNVTESQPTTPSITVLAPNGGETFIPGSLIRISWNSANLPAATTINDIRLALLGSNNQVFDLNIEANSIFSGGFNGFYSNNGRSAANDIKIPENVPAGQYKLRVSCRSCGLEDYSDSYLNIQSISTKPSISVSSPTLGSVAYAGAPLSIQWSTRNMFSSEKIVIMLMNQENYLLGYYPNTTGVANTGSYTWTLPAEIKLGKYKVQLSCTDCYNRTGAATYAWSDEFTIKSQADMLQMQNQPVPDTSLQ